MPSRKISELARKTNLTGDELVPAAHAGETYAVSISSIKSSVTKNDIGLSNVDNTPDMDKPISTLTQQALNGKASTEHTHSDYSLTTHTHSEYAQTSHVHTGDEITSPTTVVVNNIATTSYQLTLADAGKMLRFIASAAKDVDVSLLNVPANSIFHMSNRSASGDLTIVFGGGIIGNVPKNGTFILEPGDTVSIHFITATLADVYGSTKVV